MRVHFPDSFRTFQKGEKVWLEVRNLKLPYLSKKMSQKQTGPFKILNVLSPITYCLLLPRGWQIHNVFHSSLLTPFKKTEAHGPSFSPPIPDLVDREEEYKVKGILKHKIKKGKTHYLIQWKNCAPTKDSWEPEENLTHAKDAVQDYWSHPKWHTRRAKQEKEHKILALRSHDPLPPPIRKPLVSTRITRRLQTHSQIRHLTWGPRL
jgi:hypothetical protein